MPGPVHRDTVGDVLLGMPPVASFDDESIVSMDMIRAHCKLDDVAGTSDEVIRKYRRAAIEDAEAIIGRSFRGTRRVVENLTISPLPFAGLRSRFRPQVTVFRLREVPTGGRVTILPPDSPPIEVFVEQGSTRVVLPRGHGVSDNFECCQTCGEPATVWRAIYDVGVSCADEIPARVVLGILKWIAWSIENPGDTVQAVAQRQEYASGASAGTNDVAVASGALALWNRFRSPV